MFTCTQHDVCGFLFLHLYSGETLPIPSIPDRGNFAMRCRFDECSFWSVQIAPHKA